VNGHFDAIERVVLLELQKEDMSAAIGRRSQQVRAVKILELINCRHVAAPNSDPVASPSIVVSYRAGPIVDITVCN
jgi:hypothetical protein